MSNFKKMTLKNVELINIYAYINRTEKVINKKGNVIITFRALKRIFT